MNKIGVFDIDGTVHRDAMSFIVAEPVIAQFGTDEERERIAEAASTWKDRGSNESYWIYNKTILQLFENVLPRVRPGELKDIVDTVLETKGKHRYAYPMNLVGKLKEEGRTLIAISGSIKNIVEPFAQDNGFDIVIASGLEIIAGKFTGKRVAQTNKGKAELLRTVIDKHGLTLEDSYGVGDTHRDISMLNTVVNPIAFNPNAALYDEAMRRSWPIVIERKNMIYELRPGHETYIIEKAHPAFEEKHHEELQ